MNINITQKKNIFGDCCPGLERFGKFEFFEIEKYLQNLIVPETAPL